MMRRTQSRIRYQMSLEYIDWPGRKPIVLAKTQMTVVVLAMAQPLKVKKLQSVRHKLRIKENEKRKSQK